MKITPKTKLIYKIFKIIAVVGVISVASQSPYFWRAVIKDYFGHHEKYNKEILKLFYYLKQRGFIEVKLDRGLAKISLTPRGRKRLNEINIWDFKMKKSKKWDKKWRILIFDVPKEKDRIRDILRLKLREFGFYQLQKSVWIYPYECKKELVFLRELLGISSCAKIFTSTDLEAGEEILKYFKLLKIKNRKIEK